MPLARSLVTVKTLNSRNWILSAAFRVAGESVCSALNGCSGRNVLPCGSGRILLLSDSLHGTLTTGELGVKPRLSSPPHIYEDCLSKVPAEKVIVRTEWITEERLVKVTTSDRVDIGSR